MFVLDEPIILDRTRGCQSYRTTIPDSVMKLLRLGLGDYIEWGFDSSRIIVRRNGEW